MAGRDLGQVLEQRCREREVARRHADACPARGRVDLGEVLVEEAARADHDGHPPLERERDVPPHDARMRVVDEHAGSQVERLLEVIRQRHAEAVAAERLAEIAAGFAPRDRRPQVEVVGRDDGGSEHSPDGAEGTGEADGEGRGGYWKRGR